MSKETRALEEMQSRRGYQAVKVIQELIVKFVKSHNLREDVPVIPEFEAPEAEVDRFWKKLTGIMSNIYDKLTPEEKKDLVQATIGLHIVSTAKYAN